MCSKRFKNQTVFFAASVAAMALGVQSARATLLNYDDFPYAPGNVGGDVSSSGITWNTGSDDTVVTGSLTYPASVGTPPADPASTYDNSLYVPSGTTTPNRIPIQSGDASITASGSSVYYSFLLSVNTSDPNLEPNSFTGPDSTGLQGLIAGLTDGGPGTGNLGTLDNGIYIRLGSAANTVDIGIGGTRGHSTVEWSGDISASSSILVVGNYNIITNGSNYTDNVYVNPTLGQSAPTPNATSGAGEEDGGDNDGGVNTFYFTNDTGTTPAYTADELYVGTTYADVTPAGTPTPEPVSLGLLGISGLLLLRRKARPRVDRFAMTSDKRGF